MTTTITESNNFIILDKYTTIEAPIFPQSEKELEEALIKDLTQQGYIYRQDLKTNEDLLNNVREALETLNKVSFSREEWQRFVREYLDNPNENLTDKARKIHQDYRYTFTFDDGHIQNINLIDKKNVMNNRLEVIHQFEQKGEFTNRYDVTILVNGLPMVQIELKKGGVNIREAFNQVHRYSKESFNSENSLFKYLQIFIISNRSQTRYFANTTARNNDSFDYTMNWARSDNTIINDLKNFTATFLEKRTLLKVLFSYSVFNADSKLMIMRPYQIAATERILWKIHSSYLNKTWSKPESGGFIWHTTGSGKTLTSFKAAQLATELDFIDKVFFVVDRKDLDYQTIKEYQKFCKDSVNGSSSTKKLKENLEKDDNKIIVTTIQKLNNLMKSEADLPIYKKQVVFIFDECHRSQFGEAQRNLTHKFKKYYQFGFTGTPIFPENSMTGETTMSVFGTELHSYVITDAIRDNKVLKFKVDYNDVRPQFKFAEQEVDEKELSKEMKEALQHPQRIKEICQYILDNFNLKTHRNGEFGFNAMLAVSNIEAAKIYYNTFKTLQVESKKPLKVATIFSFAQNEEQNAVGELIDEGFNPSDLDKTSKAFLTEVINDYNQQFKTSFSVEGQNFENYYRDLSQRTKDKEVDLLIVVGMFLTGFDAPTLNTLFVDKPLRYHGLIQAYSRTNRIYPAKAFGNIVTFRDLEKQTKDAIKLFGKSRTRLMVLERSFADYVNGYTDEETGKFVRGYREVVQELKQSFFYPDKIENESDKRDFSRLYGEFLRLENILHNYDEFTELKKYVEDVARNEVREEEGYYRIDNKVLSPHEMLEPTKKEDYQAVYHDIRQWRKEQKDAEKLEHSGSGIDWDDVVFEVELLRSQEINLDYIGELLFQLKDSEDKEEIINRVRKVVRSSETQRNKAELLENYLEKADLKSLKTKEDILEDFVQHARGVQRQELIELIEKERLNPEATKRYVSQSLKRGEADANGLGLAECLPKMGLFSSNIVEIQGKVLNKIKHFVDKFKDIGMGF